MIRIHDNLSLDAREIIGIQINEDDAMITLSLKPAPQATSFANIRVGTNYLNGESLRDAYERIARAIHNEHLAFAGL